MLRRSFIRGLLLGCGVETVPPSEGSPGLNDGDGLPEDFGVEDLARTSLPVGMTAVPGSAEGSTGVLVWVDEQDENLDRVLTCIVWQRFRNEAGVEQWALTELFCHPERTRSLQISEALDAPHDGQRVFSAPPTNEETYRFLRDTWWTLGADPRSFRTSHALVAYQVCEGAWLRTVGVRPERPVPAGHPNRPGDGAAGLGPIGYLVE